MMGLKKEYPDSHDQKQAYPNLRKDVVLVRVTLIFQQRKR